TVTVELGQLCANALTEKPTAAIAQKSTLLTLDTCLMFNPYKSNQAPACVSWPNKCQPHKLMRDRPSDGYYALEKKDTASCWKILTENLQRIIRTVIPPRPHNRYPAGRNSKHIRHRPARFVLLTKT